VEKGVAKEEDSHWEECGIYMVLLFHIYIEVFCVFDQPTPPLHNKEGVGVASASALVMRDVYAVTLLLMKVRAWLP
jgi:hypothetical protein